MKTSKWLKPQYLFHYLLWLFFIISLIADVYTAYDRSPARFYIYVVSKTSVIVALVYTNLLLLYPVFFQRKKYFFYIITAFMLCALAGGLNTFLEIYMQSSLKGREQEVFFGQFTMAMRYLLIAFLLEITVDYYRQKETIKKIELEKINAELNFLKAQVNPHFLFNTLNNLYALILQKSDKSAESVLKLADIMKYILSEGREEKVLLEKEIKLIENYTELERLRKTDAVISFKVEGNIKDRMLTPLLLLPLIENAFKYGLNTVSRNGFINIQLKIIDNILHFSIENNNPPQSNKEALHSLGIGIMNVKERLNFLYPDKHDLQITEDPECFKVILQINLK